jgi:phosphate:Na+ symporter
MTPAILWAEVIGGLTLFFFGLRSMREGMQRFAGDRLRVLINRLTANRVLSFACGVMITAVLQSSTATTAMLVSFAGTALLSLAQAFGVILGADVGTTIVVFLLSIKSITQYALYVFTAGYFIQRWAKTRRVQYVGQVVFGFGLVFFGMYLMVTGVAPLKAHPFVPFVFDYLGEHPIISLIFSAAMTALLQSSAAMIGLAITLSFTGVLDVRDAVPVILGANIGTCLTAFMASLGLNVNARRVAVAHFLVKAVGVILAFPFITEEVKGLAAINTILTHYTPVPANCISAQIAIAHFLFNMGLAILFLPFLPMGVWIVRRLIPDPKGGEETFGPIYLDPQALETPSLAFAQVKREILRVSNIAYDMFRDAMALINPRSDFQDYIMLLQAEDDKVDVLDRAIRFYLAQLSQEQLTEEQAKIELSLLGIAADLEDIGDALSRELIRAMRKRQDKGLRFSDEGTQELCQFHHSVLLHFNVVLSYMATMDPVVLRHVEEKKELISEQYAELRYAHLKRLHEGLKESVDTSTLHLDVLNIMQRVSQKLNHIVRLTKGD